MALGRDDLNRVCQGGRNGHFVGCRPSTVVILEQMSFKERRVPSLVTHRHTHHNQIAVVPRRRRIVAYEKKRTLETMSERIRNAVNDRVDD